MIPRKVFFTKGVGHGRNEIISFENALRNAQISCYNLVKVSSILPPGCEQVTVEEGIKELSPGQIVYTVLSRNTIDNSSTVKPMQIYASIGIAQPKNPNFYGYIGESSGIDIGLEEITVNSRELATELLQSSRNGSGELEIETLVITAFTPVDSLDKFTTCIAAAVFIE